MVANRLRSKPSTEPCSSRRYGVLLRSHRRKSLAIAHLPTQLRSRPVLHALARDTNPTDAMSTHLPMFRGYRWSMRERRVRVVNGGDFRSDSFADATYFEELVKDAPEAR